MQNLITIPEPENVVYTLNELYNIDNIYMLWIITWLQVGVGLKKLM